MSKKSPESFTQRSSRASGTQIFSAGSARYTASISIRARYFSVSIRLPVACFRFSTINFDFTNRPVAGSIQSWP